MERRTVCYTALDMKKTTTQSSNPIPRIVTDDAFTRSLNLFGESVHQMAKEKGWWDGERNDGELIALMHSELSEALEFLRHGNPASDHIPNFSGAEEEMADCIIRILDMAAARGWRVGEALIAKREFNAGRAHRHGGKKF